MRLTRSMLCIAAVTALAACQNRDAAETATAAAPAATQAPAADIATAAGASASVVTQPTEGNQTVADVTFAEVDGRIHVSGRVTGLKPNSEHGFHVHEFGDCSAPDASSAGGHFNPSNKPHAHPGHGHDGAMKNLVADAEGIAVVDDELPDTVNIGKGDDFDIVGHALIVHSDPDDYVSQPVGNAGKRLTCGVIALK